MTDPRPRKIGIPRLLHLGRGCLGKVAPLLSEHEFDLERVLVASGPGPSRRFAEQVAEGLRADGITVVEHPGMVGRLDQAAALAAQIIEHGVTVAVAVGGGRAIDPVKLAASRTRIDFVSIPTTISNDGISSPVASLIGRKGSRETHAARMPSGIVVDVEAITSAPPRTVRAGVGDLVSNLTACMDWRLSDRGDHDRYDAFSAMIAEAAARPALDLQDLESTSSHELLAQGLLLSGLAMATAGTSRPCSGAEHLVSHALDAQLRDTRTLHGEQVALGTLISAAAHRSPLLGVLRETFLRLGLPTAPRDLGLTGRQLVDAVLLAPTMRRERWTILNERVHSAADAAELVEDAFFTEPSREPAPALDQPAAATSTAGMILSMTRFVA